MTSAAQSAHIRILVVDDHPVVRDGLVAILTTQPDFAVVGEASDGSEAVTLTARLRPDVLLLDLEMPQTDGVEVLRRLRAQGIAVRALVFTAFDTDERIFSAVQAGARGYLLKGAPRERLFEAIRTLYAGGALLQPAVTARLHDHVNAPSVPERELLTTREMDVLRRMAKGWLNKEIAADLVITERTVKFHVSSILHKLGAGNRTEAVTLAIQQGLVEA